MTKIIKKLKDYSYKERLKKLGLTTLLERRMRDDLIEAFNIINGILNYGNFFFFFFFFNISPWTGNLTSMQISKIKSTNKLDFFANQMKNSNRVENLKIKLDYFRKKW